MKKISIIFVFFIIMMGLFLIPKVEAAQIDFSDEALDEKGMFLAPDSIYIYIKQDGKEWEKTLTDNNPNSTEILGAVYTEKSFIKDKEIEVLMITPNTDKELKSKYDVDITITANKTENVEIIGEPLIKYREVEGINYLAFLYTLKLKKNEFGTSLKISCYTKGTWNNNDVDFQLPLFIHIEQTKDGYDYYNITHQINVEKEIEKKFGNKVIGDGPIWILMRQGTNEYSLYISQNKNGTSSNRSKLKGYNTSGTKFRKNEDIEVLIVTGTDSPCNTEYILTYWHELYDDENKKMNVNGDILNVKGDDTSGQVLTIVNYGKRYCASHFKFKIRDRYDPDETTRIMFQIEDVNSSGIWHNNINLWLELDIYTYPDESEYNSNDYQINVDKILNKNVGEILFGMSNENKTYYDNNKSLKENFKNYNTETKYKDVIYVYLKQGNKEWAYIFGEKNTGITDINSACEITDRGFATGTVVFNAYEDIEMLVITNQYEFAKKISGGVNSENGDLEGNVTKLLSRSDADYNYGLLHMKFQVKDYEAIGMANIIIYASTVEGSNGTTKGNVSFRLPLAIYIHDKNVSNINFRQEMINIYNNGSHKIETPLSEQKKKIYSQGTIKSISKEYLCDINGSCSYKNGTIQKDWTDLYLDQNSKAKSIYVKIIQGDNSWDGIVEGKISITEDSTKHLEYSFSHAYTYAEERKQGRGGVVFKNGVHYSVWHKYNDEATNIKVEVNIQKIPMTLNVNEEYEILYIFRPEVYSYGNAYGSMTVSSDSTVSYWDDNYKMQCVLLKNTQSNDGSYDMNWTLKWKTKEEIKQGSATEFNINWSLRFL